MKRSHSRSSYPFDKPVPYEEMHWLRIERADRTHQWGGRTPRLNKPWHQRRPSPQFAIVKRLHGRKQRQYNRKLLQHAQDDWSNS